MKTFKRASAAYAAAGDDQPILAVRSGKETLYIVGLDRMDCVELISNEQQHGSAPNPSRSIRGTMLLGHFDRLGNANHAGAAKYDRDRRIWPDQWGYGETFVNPASELRYKLDRMARDANKGSK